MKEARIRGITFEYLNLNNYKNDVVLNQGSKKSFHTNVLISHASNG